MVRQRGTHGGVDRHIDVLDQNIIALWLQVGFYKLEVFGHG